MCFDGKDHPQGSRTMVNIIPMTDEQWEFYCKGFELAERHHARRQQPPEPQPEPTIKKGMEIINSAVLGYKGEDFSEASQQKLKDAGFRKVMQGMYVAERDTFLTERDIDALYEDTNAQAELMARMRWDQEADTKEANRTPQGTTPPKDREFYTRNFERCAKEHEAAMKDIEECMMYGDLT